VTRRSFDDRGYIDRHVQAIDAGVLQEPVRSVLRDPAARVTAWTSGAIAYDFLNPSSGGIYRFTGTAKGAEAPTPWSLVLKVTRSAEGLHHDLPVPSELAATLADAVLWDRELIAYESGFLDRLGDESSFVAAAWHGGARHEDGTSWLWLEDLGDSDERRWSLEAWQVVARALGRFNGGYLAGGRVPDHPWLGRQWLRVWATQLTPLHFGVPLEGPAWDQPVVREAYPSPAREQIGALWADREALLQAVEALPRTCSHLDAHRRNLFLRGEQVVAIDWGLLGLAAPGEEIAATLVGTVASGEVPVKDAAALAATLYDGYLAGLRDAGWDGDERDVRLAFTAAAGLRAFSVLGLHEAGNSDRLARWAALAGFLLDLGDEARAALC
jgi:hypothetical protein